MKKILAIVLALAMVLGLAACGSPKETTAAPTEAPKTTEAPVTTAAPTEAPTTEPAPTESEAKVLSYEEFMATEQMEPVLIEAYVQAKQEYYAGHEAASLYLADQDGGYFCYECKMTQDQYDKLKLGTKVRISGERKDYAGLAEIQSGILEEIDENDLFEEAFMDVSDIVGDTEALAKVMNRMVSFSNMVIMPQNDGEAINRKESDSDPDLYFSAGNEYGAVSFCVESYLTGKDSEAYKAVEALKVGDIVNVEGFMYWYNGANPHVTGVEVVGNVNDKSEGVMTYEEFLAVEQMEPVVIEAYVQGKQAYYAAQETASLYLADADGGYFCYDCSLTQEEYEKLEPGTKVRISGDRKDYAGLVEVQNGKVEEVEEDGVKYVAQPVDVTVAIGFDEILDYHMSKKIVAKDLVVMAQDDGSAIWKKENDGDPDLAFRAAGEYGVTNFYVESYLTGADTEVHKTVENLKIGDVITVEAFLYWYNGANPHVTAITVTGNVNEKSEGVMTYEEFLAVEQMEPVVIEAYVQGKQAYYEAQNTASLYLADADGGYFCYGCSLTQEEYEKLEPGTKVRISGDRKDYGGLVEIQNGKLEEILEGKYISAPVNIYDASDEEALAKLMNRKVIFRNMVIQPQDNGDAVGYKQDDNDPDIYIKADNGTGVIDFCVESYLIGRDTDVYEYASNVEPDEKVDILCFMYWYNGVNPHVIDLSYVTD
ncbi:MAG: acid shock protein [Lachnospiraceae bacterium]|nr:acid shock protein [Lachnospiraceae bacterium]